MAVGVCLFRSIRRSISAACMLCVGGWHVICLLFGMIEGIFNRENYEAAKLMLDASVLRHTAIASNIANVETPGYKRVDLDPKFESQLVRLLQSGSPQGLDGVQPSLMVDSKSPSVRPDGNNVKIDSEMLSMNRNAMEFEFLAQYMNRSFKRVKTAISGTVSNA